MSPQSWPKVDVVRAAILSNNASGVDIMKRVSLTMIVLAFLGIGTAEVATSKPVIGYKGEALAAKAKVTLDQARAIALKARPGKITDYELENEHGGSGLRYSFDIEANAKPYEVGVDARKGLVLENKPEGSHPD
jgi:hypothetical protein